MSERGREGILEAEEGEGYKEEEEENGANERGESILSRIPCT